MDKANTGWDDCKQFNFLSAGQDRKWSDPIRTLEPGDIVIPYLKSHGFVGIGRVKEKAIRIADFKYKGKSLRDVPLRMKNMFNNSDNDNSEYVVKVEWLKAVDSDNAKWLKKGGLFTTQLIKASLQSQPMTLEFIQTQFHMDIVALLKQD